MCVNPLSSGYFYSGRQSWPEYFLERRNFGEDIFK